MDIEQLREEMRAERREQEQRFEAAISGLRRDVERGKPLPAAATLRAGYEQSEARKAARDAEGGGFE